MFADAAWLEREASAILETRLQSSAGTVNSLQGVSGEEKLDICRGNEAWPGRFLAWPAAMNLSRKVIEAKTQS